MEPNTFNLDVQDLYAFYLVAVITCVLLLFRAQPRVGSVNISLNTSDSLKGFFILTVVLHHFSQRIDHPSLFIVYHIVGYLSVAMFLLLSGYGLTVSQQNKNDTPSTFFKKRLLRVALPFVLANAVTLLIRNNGDLSSLKNTLSLIPVDSTQWFIYAILYYYVLFYIARQSRHMHATLLAGTITYMAACVLMDFGSWWYVSALAFNAGSFIADKQVSLGAVIEAYRHKIKLALAIFVATVVCVLLANKGAIIACSAAILFCASVLICTYRLELASPPLMLMGRCSLEVYVLHMKLMQLLHVLYVNDALHSSAWILVYFVVLALASVAFHALNNALFKLLAGMHMPLRLASAPRK